MTNFNGQDPNFHMKISYTFTQPYNRPFMVDLNAREAYHQRLHQQAVERELERLDALENVVEFLDHSWIEEYLMKK